jgi:hypothetical protein
MPRRSAKSGKARRKSERGSGRNVRRRERPADSCGQAAPESGLPCPSDAFSDGIWELVHPDEEGEPEPEPGDFWCGPALFDE